MVFIQMCTISNDIHTNVQRGLSEILSALQICSFKKEILISFSAWARDFASECRYGVALVSRINNIIGLFCKRSLLKRRYSAKETYNFIDPTDR